MRKRFFRFSLVGLFCVALAATTIWIVFHRHNSSDALAAAPGSEAYSPQVLQVAVAKPTAGGIERTTNVPATVIAFESANLFAKISGYLKTQNVDIGDRVKSGQVLAEIDSPEYVKAVDQAKAALEEAKAQVKQAEAGILTAEADERAAKAAAKKARADVLRYQGARELCEKQCKRLKEIYESRTIDRQLIDEQECGLQSARSAEESASAGVESADALSAAAAARISHAKAMAVAARSNVGVVEAALHRADVFVSYLTIVAPFDGVVTSRNFFRGDYICSADQQGHQPLLTVDRTDRMRVVVQVPDCDVPLARLGAIAKITIDALPAAHFSGKISRLATAEHSETRTMRAEIDLENGDGLICHGMYGYASIELPRPAKAMLIPLSALVGTATNGTASVHIVKNGFVETAKVRLGRDNGAQAEVFDGLSPDDQVVVKNTAELVEGAAVSVARSDGQPDLRKTDPAVVTTARGVSAQN